MPPKSLTSSCSRRRERDFILPVFRRFLESSTVNPPFFAENPRSAKVIKAKRHTHGSAHNPEVVRFKSHPRNHKKALMHKHRGSFFAFLEIPLYADLDGFRGIFFAGYSPVEYVSLF